MDVPLISTPAKAPTLLALAALLLSSSAHAEAVVSGELRRWHKVTVTVDGPEASEQGKPNPFLDYRMDVTFNHAESGLAYTVPGYFAADGDAANTSADSGSKWRAHLSPDEIGEWTYEVSFRSGEGVAVSEQATKGTVVSGSHGLSGTFLVKETDKRRRDFRGKGRLAYAGGHYLRFKGDGEYFLKAGADAPENLLAYRDLDGDFANDGRRDKFVKDWAPHVRDWRRDDPTWGDGKGKGLIGAINYLADQGLNGFSFLTLNIEGDDRNVFPYTTYDERERLDCSRLDQWEILFEHADRIGMHLHFKTQEAENVNLLDNGELGPQRMLYYRELIARFAHHLALNWNLGEEVGLGHKVSTAKKQAWAGYFAEHDPYRHHLVIHNGDNHFDLLGDASPLTGFSLQTNRADFGNVHGATLRYLRKSAAAGKPWVVACDEPGDAQHALIPDAEDPTRDAARQNALWGNLMAGGAGVEWYFGYKHDHSDLTCEDFRVRENMWRQSRIAIDFFRNHGVRFWDMVSDDGRLSGAAGYCLSNPGESYLVFRKGPGEMTIDLIDAGSPCEVLWFNPREGGPLLEGSKRIVEPAAAATLGEPPADPDRDWLVVVRPLPNGRAAP